MTQTIAPITTPTVRKVSPSWLLKGNRGGTLPGRATEEPVATDADVAEAQAKVARWFAEIDEQCPRPAAQKAADPVETVEQVCQVWDDEFDEPYVAANEEPSQETLALCEADTTPLNLDEPLALEVRPDWMQAEPNTEPGPVVEPVALRPVSPEQKAYFVKFVMNSDQSKKYAMVFRKSDGLAVNCECKSRKFHRGVACKHMKAHNAMLTPAKTATQAA